VEWPTYLQGLLCCHFSFGDNGVGILPGGSAALKKTGGGGRSKGQKELLEKVLPPAVHHLVKPQSSTQ
jgi:hypothetical protein